MLCSYKEWMTLSFYKNVYVFISLERGQSFCGVWETDGRTETNTDCHIDPKLLLLLTIPCYVIFKASFSTYSASRPGVLNWRPAVGSCLSGAPSHTLALFVTRRISPGSKLRLTQLTLSVSHVGIYIYHFMTPTHFRSTTWLLPLIFRVASCAENLWLTVRSRVSRQKKKLNNVIDKTFLFRKFAWI